MDLNPAQRDAVNTLQGPLLVLAGAGSGKTRVVTYRIAELIKHGVAPARILAVTFTKKAAGEMQSRAAELLGRGKRERPDISTFHSLCVRILRRQIRRLGYPEAFVIYDRGDQESLARAALRDIKVPNEVLKPGDVVNQISRWKTASVRPAEAASLAETDKEHLAASAYRRYQTALKLAGAVDFDDLLLLTEELFQKYAEVRQQEAGRYSHLLIDEYQDTNGPQYRIVKTLAGGHRNLCVVGDDDQSIYGWRGADVSHILRFKHDWPEAKVVRLEDNYRSTAPILEMANRLIAFNRQRHDKVLRAARAGGEPPRIIQYPDEISEARTVIEEIRTQVLRQEASPRDFAILFRTNEQPRAFETELRRAKLPYILVGGMSFYDRKEVRDVLAYIKLLVQPRDEVSLLRIINTPPRGIGQSTVASLLESAVANSQPLWEVLTQAGGNPEARRVSEGASVADSPSLTLRASTAGADFPKGMSRAAAQGIANLQSLVEEFQARAKQGSLAELVRELIAKIGYQQEITRLYKTPEEQTTRWNSIEEVVNAVANYEKRSREPTLTGFLEDVTLGDRDDDREKESQLARDCVALMTLHSAKGLEFPQVYLVGMEENLLPHHRSIAAEGDAIDEERRLCYVGITRARDRLTMTLSLSRMKWGKPRPTQPSRFLFEITGQADNPHSARGKPRPRQVRR